MLNIVDSIKEAFNTLSGKTEEVKDEKPGETKETDETSEKKPDEKPLPDNKNEKPAEAEKPKLDEDKVKKALDLYDSLHNPDTAPEAIQYLVSLAQKAGVVKKDDTPKEQKAAVKDIIEQIKETYPEEQHELIDLLGPALKAAIKAAADGNKAEVETLQKKLKDFEQSAEQKIYTEKVITLLGAYPEEDLPKMHELMQQFAPPEGQTEEEYFKNLHKMVKATATKTASSNKKDEKIKKNSEEALPSSSGKGDDEFIIMNRDPTMSESIAAARQNKKIKIQTS